MTECPLKDKCRFYSFRLARYLNTMNRLAEKALDECISDRYVECEVYKQCKDDPDKLNEEWEKAVEVLRDVFGW